MKSHHLISVVAMLCVALSAAQPARADATNPYTGLPIANEAMNRRPILVKLANTVNVRPQAGLGQADVVIEHMVEGGGTRFSALFLSNTPSRVGSTRSCRLVDIELPVIFGAALNCSGTSAGVRQRMARNSFLFPNGGGDWKNSLTLINDSGRYECEGCAMFRASGIPVPHNLFNNPAAAWKTLAARGLNQPSGFAGFHFDNAASAGGKPAAKFTVKYNGGNANWAYDQGSGRYLRSTSNAPQVDPTTGKRMSAANVLALQAFHINTDIVEDRLGSKSIEIQLWGSGPAKLYRDGQVFDGTWTRGAGVYNFQLRHADGSPMALKPGPTWIQIVNSPSQIAP